MWLGGWEHSLRRRAHGSSGWRPRAWLARRRITPKVDATAARLLDALEYLGRNGRDGGQRVSPFGEVDEDARAVPDVE